jgi:competence protein ComEA
MTSPKGTLVLALLLLFLGGRELFRVHYGDKAPEAEPFISSQVLVYLGGGFPEQGMHHFSDDFTLRNVIKMTLFKPSVDLPENPAMDHPLRSGEALELLYKSDKIIEVKRFWSPAETRMAFFIPLHPDRMSLRDWEALPGLGPHLAMRIEQDRQKNGDFGCLKNLARVKGIAEGRIQQLKNYF